MEFFKRKKPNNEDGDDINKLIKELLNSHKKEYKNIENFLKYFLRYQNVEILSLSLKKFLNHLDLLKKEIDHEISYEENLGLKNINSHLEEKKEIEFIKKIIYDYLKRGKLNAYEDYEITPDLKMYDFIIILNQRKRYLEKVINLNE